MTGNQTGPLELTREIIRANGLVDWFEDFPWLTGALGDPRAAVWFVAENPSLAGVRAVDATAPSSSPNLQWTCNEGTSSRLLREAIAEAGLKDGDICEDSGWRCYITNADKEPQEVGVRNKGKKRDFMMQQARRWQPVLQAQIDQGAPEILVALGGQVEQLLRYMRQNGLRAPAITKIHHYSYIWLRPESGTRRGPRHPDRIAEWKRDVRDIAARYRAHRR